MRTLLSNYSRYSLNIILLSFFSHMSYFRKKVQRGNQLVPKKKLSKKKNVFKNYFTTWETNNCNADIVHCLKKLKQSDNKIWSVTRI